MRDKYYPLLERARREAPFQQLAEGTRVVFADCRVHGKSYAFGIVVKSEGCNKCQLVKQVEGPRQGNQYDYHYCVMPDWSKIEQEVHWVSLLPSDPTGQERLYHHPGRKSYGYKYDEVYDENKKYEESYCNYD